MTSHPEAPASAVHSPEFRALLDQLWSRPFNADSTPVSELRAGWERFAAAWADPPPVTLESVDAGGVPAEWSRPAGERTDAAVLYLHGGGYTIGSVPSYRDLTARIATNTGLPVLSVEYRLAPEHRFPAAVEDSTAAFGWLAQRVAPERIVVVGDSAGGGLAVATALALREGHRPGPGGLALISPMADLALTGRSVEVHAAVDPIVTPAGSRAYAERYVGPDGDLFHPLVSPAFADLHGMPPTHIQVGTAEVRLDDALRLARGLRDAGARVDLDVWPDMIHILPFFASRIPEARAALAGITTFISTRVDAPADTVQ